MIDAESSQAVSVLYDDHLDIRITKDLIEFATFFGQSGADLRHIFGNRHAIRSGPLRNS